VNIALTVVSSLAVVVYEFLDGQHVGHFGVEIDAGRVRRRRRRLADQGILIVELIAGRLVLACSQLTEELA